MSWFSRIANEVRPHVPPLTLPMNFSFISINAPRTWSATDCPALKPNV
jgi:hypothetical protein